jgi:cytosine permease
VRGKAAAGAPGYRITLILLGIIVTPVVLSSPTLGSGIGLSRAVSAIIVGSAILMAIAIMTLSIGEHGHQVTYDIVRFPSGRTARRRSTSCSR